MNLEFAVCSVAVVHGVPFQNWRMGAEKFAQQLAGLQLGQLQLFRDQTTVDVAVLFVNGHDGLHTTSEMATSWGIDEFLRHHKTDKTSNMSIL